MLRQLHRTRHGFRHALSALLFVYLSVVSHAHGAKPDAVPASDALGSCLVCALGAAPDGEDDLPSPAGIDAGSLTVSAQAAKPGIAGENPEPLHPCHAPRAPPVP